MWIAIGIIILIAICIFLYYENNSIEISKYEAPVNLGSSIKIVHISDLHGKQFGKCNVRLTEKVDMIKPDIIVYTGDLIDDDGKNIERCISFLTDLNKRYPVYFVPGNNEHQSGWYEKIILHLKQGGIHVLENRIETVIIRQKPVHILGFDEKIEPYSGYGKRTTDPNAYTDYSPLFLKLAGMEGLKLVMTHYPENFSMIGERSYGNYSFDLMFAGHAHGGQFVFPFIGGLFAPGQGVFPKYTDGIYGNIPKMCVSRGLGRSAFPFRLFNRPQVIDLTIL